MGLNRRKVFGWLLLSAGILIAAFSPQIVFPGLERLIGIETIVGRENVEYSPDGSYLFTNPAAMVRWIAVVATLGLFVAVSGVVVLFKARAPKTSNS